MWEGYPPHPSVTGMTSSTNQRASRDLLFPDSCCYGLPLTSCFFPLGGYKSGDSHPELESADPETMSEEEPFWGEMARLLAQDEDEVFHRALEEWEPVQRGGAAAAAVDDEAGGAGPSRGRFDFRLDPFVDRRSQRLGVHERVFRARVHQRGTFDHHDQLAARFVQGLRTSLAQMLQDPSIADRDRVYFHLASDRLRHAYDGWGLTAGEWRRDEGRVARLLGNLSRMLNSNENFQMDDTFHLSFVHVRAGPYGGGTKRKYLPGHQSSTRLKVMKQTAIAIPQTDANLCCARALVTARAYVEKHPKWRSFQRGYPLQLNSALELHQRAGVRLGPCGADELHQFARALPDYSLVVVDANRAYACFAYGRGAQRLGILHEDGHYDALTSLAGFFGIGYFCSFCYQAYNHAGQHACTNNPTHCGGCLQNGCSDYRDAYAH